MDSIPPLENWHVNGDALTAWINAFQCYEIVPGEVCGFALSLNDTSTATSTPLGVHGDIPAAQAAARRHLGDE